jgi:hypothetical protein
VLVNPPAVQELELPSTGARKPSQSCHRQHPGNVERDQLLGVDVGRIPVGGLPESVPARDGKDHGSAHRKRVPDGIRRRDHVAYSGEF